MCTVCIGGWETGLAVSQRTAERASERLGECWGFLLLSSTGHGAAVRLGWAASGAQRECGASIRCCCCYFGASNPTAALLRGIHPMPFPWDGTLTSPWCSGPERACAAACSIALAASGTGALAALPNPIAQRQLPGPGPAPASPPDMHPPAYPPPAALGMSSNRRSGGGPARAITGCRLPPLSADPVLHFLLLLHHTLLVLLCSAFLLLLSIVFINACTPAQTPSRLSRLPVLTACYAVIEHPF